MMIDDHPTMIDCKMLVGILPAHPHPPKNVSLSLCILRDCTRGPFYWHYVQDHCFPLHRATGGVSTACSGTLMGGGLSMLCVCVCVGVDV